MPGPHRALLLLLAGVLGAAAPTPAQQTWLLSIPAPPSMEAAIWSATTFISYDLRYPETAQFTFRPPVRAMLMGRPNDPPIAGVYLCGTVRDRALLSPQVFMVMFGEHDPLQIEGGHIAVGKYAFNRDWCDQVYRDGLPVFPPTRSAP